MIFKRTSGALFSIHKFFKVDKVVYCEGGDQEITLADAHAGQGSEESGDIRYWQAVARLLESPRTYKFKSVGSKTVALAIAADIISQRISTVNVCFDRDYDWHIGKQVVDDAVIYTYGYSFENDVVSSISLRKLLYRLLGQTEIAERLSAELDDDIRKFSKVAAYWCEIDISLVAKNRPAIFPKKKPGYCIAIDPVRLNEAKLRSDLTALGYSRRPRRLVSLSANEGIRYTHGKTVLLFAYSAFISRVKKHDKKITLTKDVFLRLLITETFDAVAAGELPELHAYLTALRPQLA